MKLRIGLIFILFLSYTGTCLFAQAMDSTLDQNLLVPHKGANLLLQFVGGNVGYAIPFFVGNGYAILTNNHQEDGEFGIILGLVGCGFSVAKIAELTSKRDVSYIAGIGGALLSVIGGGALYTYTSERVQNKLARFLILSIPPTLVSMLFVDLTLGANTEVPSKFQIWNYLYPEVSPHYAGLHLSLKY